MSSKGIKPILANFFGCSLNESKKDCVHITNMSGRPVYRKTLRKSSFPKTHGTETNNILKSILDPYVISFVQMI